jgi:hypothetical protein|tara:strand:- start:13 stop:240 length:228 start_codon:yes stop_codon:yes gene_type:complete
LVFLQFEDKGYSFHGVAEELRKVIIEMLVQENQVLVKVVVESIQVEENLLEILLNQSNYPYQFNIPQSGNNIVRN